MWQRHSADTGVPMNHPQSDHPPTADDLVLRFREEALSTAFTLGLRQRRMQAEIAERLGAPLAFLETFLAFTREIHSDILSDGEKIDLFQSSDRFLVETRLHARACQIAAEISTLLRAGFADGAHARWRSLHEVASVALFITAFEDNDRLGRRFMDYHEVEVYELAKRRWKHRDREDVWSISEDEYVAAEQRFEELKAEYGASFVGLYGWAADALGKHRVSFASIEDWLELNHRRTEYEMANGNIHASSRGTLWRLGSQNMGNSRYDDGRSAQGLERTIAATAISLNQASFGLYGAFTSWPWQSRWEAQWELENDLGTMLLDILHPEEDSSAATQTSSHAASAIYGTSTGN